MDNSQKIRNLQFLNWVAFLLMITINALANILPLNGKTTGEIAAQYPNLFVPENLTFAIWGLIYLMLLGFVIYQGKGFFQKGESPSELVEKIGYSFILSSVLNSAWILAWHYEKVFLSVLIMILLLLTLIKIYLNLEIGLPSQDNPKTMKERFFSEVPFSIYLGWISIATIANITTWLVSINWNRFGLSELFWTIVVIFLGTILALLFLQKRNDIFYSLVVIWAFIGIIIKRSEGLTNHSLILIFTLVFCIGIILIKIFHVLKKD